MDKTKATTTDAKIPEVLDYWEDKEGAAVASGILGVYATVLFVWFAGCVRANVSCAERPGGRLASTLMAGATIAAAGLLLLAGTQILAADTAGEVSPEVTQTLSAMHDNLWTPLSGGFALFLLASGLGAIRHGALDRRLGWIAIGLGVLCLTPAGVVGFLGGVAWSAIAGVVLYRKAAAALDAPAAPQAP